MSDNDDQARSDNIFYTKMLHLRMCKALNLDPDCNSLFDIADKVEELTKRIGTQNED